MAEHTPDEEATLPRQRVLPANEYLINVAQRLFQEMPLNVVLIAETIDPETGRPQVHYLTAKETTPWGALGLLQVAETGLRRRFGRSDDA